MDNKTLDIELQDTLEAFKRIYNRLCWFQTQGYNIRLEYRLDQYELRSVYSDREIRLKPSGIKCSASFTRKVSL